jgi:S-adenosylmethionine/arginine decarboxylase-like enzyme
MRSKGGNTRKAKSKGSWGYHLTIDAGGCDHDALRSKATIAAFSKELVDKIDMVAYGKPRIVMFGEGNKKGYTLIQLIETSNIAAHFVEETDDIYLDIFSCKKFVLNDAIAVFKKYFKPTTMVKRFIVRQAKSKKMTRKLK